MSIIKLQLNLLCMEKYIVLFFYSVTLIPLSVLPVNLYLNKIATEKLLPSQSPGKVFILFYRLWT